MATRPADPSQPLSIEVEMRRESTFALRTVSQKLEEQLAELARLAAEIAQLSGAARARQVAAYQRLRTEAEHQRWCLVVQREAMGLRIHRILDELYPIPRLITG